MTNDNENAASAGSPVLRTRQVGPWRILGTKPRPQPDSALVCATVDGTFRTLDRPMTAGEWAFRGLRRVVEVDMATRRQVLRFALPSKWDVPPFQATLEIWWRVVDPAEVVRQRINDMGGEFLARHMVELRGVARTFPYAASSEAEQELNTRLPHQESWLIDGAVKVLRVYLRVDQDDMVHGHQMDQLAERHQAHITAIRRESLARFIVDGQVGMLAYHLTQHPDDALDVAEALAAQEQVSLETSLQIMFQALNSGKIQDVEAERLHEEAIQKLLAKVRNGSPKAFQKLKDQHQAALAKADAPEESPAENAAEKTVVDAEVVDEKTDDEADG